MSYPPQEVTIHEVQKLRQELAYTHNKLQDYADTIVSLHGELRTLRDGICSTCKRKFVPANLVSSESQAVEPVMVSSVNQISPSRVPAEETNLSFSWSRLLKAVSDLIPTPPTFDIHRPTTANSQPFPSTMPQPLPILSTPPLSPPIYGDEEPTLVSNAPRVASSSRSPTLQSLTMDPPWSAKRDATADPVLDVTFVCAFDHTDSVQSVRFSANGKCFAVALKHDNNENNGTIFIYDVETCKKSCVIADYASQYSSKERPGINCLCFSPVGRYLVFGDMAGRVTVWDIQTKRIRNVFRGHSKSIEAVDFSPNGRLVLSASWDSVVRIWNLRDGSARVFSDRNLCSTCVRFSSSGRYVAVPGHFRFILRIWDLRTGRLVKKVIKHEGDSHSKAFTLDEKGLLSGDLLRPVTYWDDSILQLVQPDAALLTLAYIGHTGTVSSVVISPNRQWVVSTSHDKTAILWDRRTAVRQYTLIGHTDAVSSADFSPTGTYFATGSKDGYVTLWRYHPS